jgi:hypothetical protein
MSRQAISSVRGNRSLHRGVKFSLLIPATIGWLFPAIWAFGATTEPATRPAATQPSPAVVAAVQDLTNDDFGIRQAAQQKLVEMGESIEPQLRELLTGDLSDEVRARISGALHSIDENKLLSPSATTLHFRDAPLQNVLEDFSRQTGAELGVSGARIVEYAKTRRVSVDLDHAGFLSALQAISQAAGLRPGLNGANSLVLMPGWSTANPLPFNIFNPRQQTVGAFTVFEQSCEQDCRIEYGRAAASVSSLTLQLMVMAEPKLHVIGPVNQDWLKECVDENGQSLLPDVHQTFIENNGSRQWYWPLQTTLKAAGGLGKRIARLRGELKFTVQIKSELIELSDLSRLDNLTRNIGGNSITLNRFGNEGGQYQLRVLVSGPLANDIEQIQNLLSTIQILDDQNEQLLAGPMVTQSDSIGTMQITVSYLANHVIRVPDRPAVAGILVPKKLRWELTTQTRVVTVPFELKNLELPHAP